MTVSPQYLAEHYDDVASAVNNGETVEVSLPEKPALRLVPSKPKQAVEQTGLRILGAGKADVRFVLDNWDEVDRKWRKSLEEKFGSDETC
jgi:antitoxin (DNA-binding transcriptional repressor) of toxin-antitoxin stability system